MAKISVLGAGSWGTALSILLYNNGHEVILWSALGEEITTLREKRELFCVFKRIFATSAGDLPDSVKFEKK